jgi:hypothetical protein
VERKDFQVPHSSHEEESHGHADIEPIIVKVMGVQKQMAAQMQKKGIDCEAIPIGSHALEGKPYYSHLFPMTSRLVTNKGLIKVNGKNVDFVQVLQRS